MNIHSLRSIPVSWKAKKKKNLTPNWIPKKIKTSRWFIENTRHQPLFWTAKLNSHASRAWKDKCNKDSRNTEQKDDKLPRNCYRTVHKLLIQPLRQLRKSFSVLLISSINLSSDFNTVPIVCPSQKKQTKTKTTQPRKPKRNSAWNSSVSNKINFKKLAVLHFSPKSQECIPQCLKSLGASLGDRPHCSSVKKCQAHLTSCFLSSVRAVEGPTCGLVPACLPPTAFFLHPATQTAHSSHNNARLPHGLIPFCYYH